MSDTDRVVRYAAVLAGILAAIATLNVSQAQEPVSITRDPARAERAARVWLALERGLDYVPGEMLVRFESNTEGFANAQALGVLHASLEPSNIRWVGDVLHLTSLDGAETLQAVEEVARQPGVLWAQPNYIVKRQAHPNDSGFSRQWNMNAIDLPGAWDINPGAASGVTVAVLDSGLTTTDGTFQFSIWTPANSFGLFAVPMARAEDFNHVNVLEPVDLQPFGGWFTSDGPIYFDADGHGTHVAATVAQQTNNTFGFAGAAYGVTLLPIKVCFSPWDVQLAAGADGIPGLIPATFEGCDLASMAEGIRYAADNGVNVINISIGGTAAQPAVRDALQYAVSRGVFVSISSGNEALDGNPTMYPAAYAGELGGVVAVGAVTPALQRAGYSSHGTYVELVAPGGPGSSGPAAEQILQIAPNRLDLSLFRLSPAFNRYQEWGISGTSMASPHVAGVAALLYSQGVTSPAAIEAILERFARDLGPAGRDNEYGHGLVDARATIRGLGVAR